MHNVYDAFRKQVVNLVVNLPGQVKEIEVIDGGNVVASLHRDGKLLITIVNPSKEKGDTTVFENVVRFALRPSVRELAVVEEGSCTIDRYSLFGALAANKIKFAHPSAIGYNTGGSLLAARSGRFTTLFCTRSGKSQVIWRNSDVRQPPSNSWRSHTRLRKQG